MTIYLEIPIELKSEMNVMQHWTKKHRKRKSQIWAIKSAWMEKKQKNVQLPSKVILCRHSPRELDYDNLVGAFKWIRDAVADLLIPGKAPGQADKSGDIEFEYKQEKSKKKYISITVSSRKNVEIK